MATPGRLWELQSQGQEYLQNLHTVKYLVIDEADRMAQKVCLNFKKSVSHLRSSSENIFVINKIMKRSLYQIRLLKDY